DAPTAADPLTFFGVTEARLHRQRGVTLAMFLGLMKYYRQGYSDLIAEKYPEGTIREQYRYFVDRCFDTIELAFCAEWEQVPGQTLLEEVQARARYMTNEKNAYLTVFESLADPVIMLDRNDQVINYNHAAARLIEAGHIPGGLHYHPAEQAGAAASLGKSTGDSANRGKPLHAVFPWLIPVLAEMKCGGDNREIHECVFASDGNERAFAVSRSDMLDISEKFTSSIIILRDITGLKNNREALQKTISELTQALAEVKQLSGLLPICAGCKKIRDDHGYWQQVEQYVSTRTDVRFSHGLCPECTVKLYPDYAAKWQRKPLKDAPSDKDGQEK
ncbi:MAG: hypothetical protein JW832_02205, partial [Deltaproteobacteria bacterium]|nr:hypothetical protein [Deltaproteobacteria bacterium]